MIFSASLHSQIAWPLALALVSLQAIYQVPVRVFIKFDGVKAAAASIKEFMPQFSDTFCLLGYLLG